MHYFIFRLYNGGNRIVMDQLRDEISEMFFVAYNLGIFLNDSFWNPNSNENIYIILIIVYVIINNNDNNNNNINNNNHRS